jgi:antigen flippase
MAAISETLVVSTSMSTTASPAKLAEKHSYGEILKSSVLVGGSSFLNIGIGIIRTKAMALLLGPSGFGLFGLYNSVADLTQAAAGLGVSSSGVRQIAESVGTGDEEQIARTAAVLRRTSIILGVIGAASLLLFSRQIAKTTFGGTKQAISVSLLSIVVLFKLISAGQGALIQGTRRIADLAKMSVFGALFGIVTSIPLVYFFRERGVVPAIISVAAVTVLTSWWYSRKIVLKKIEVTLPQVWQETRALLKLGSVFMASGFMTLGVAYFVRITLLRIIGFEATGLYQSAWNLGGFYVGIILQAMGADFYPRLTAAIRDHARSNRLVNEQTLVGLLVAGPGVLATLTFAPLVLSFFYSSKFGAAVGILRWICLGATLQVITWPMGFISVAKGRQGIFFFSEFVWTIFAVTAAWICVKRYALEGAGIAFFASYVFHWLITYPIAWHLTRFRWSSDNKRTGLMYFALTAITFCGFQELPMWWATAVGMVTFAFSAVHSARALARLAPLDRLPLVLQRFLGWLGLAPALTAVEVPVCN